MSFLRGERKVALKKIITVAILAKYVLVLEKRYYMDVDVRVYLPSIRIFFGATAPIRVACLNDLHLLLLLTGILARSPGAA